VLGHHKQDPSFYTMMLNSRLID